jgi:putative membrane protein
MKKAFTIIIILLTVLTITLSLMVLIKDDESLYLNKSNEYLENPKGYMEKLNEKYQVKEKEHEIHDTHDTPTGYYENLKNELIQSNKLVFTDGNYTSIMYVIDKYHESFLGKQVELIGFIYREPEFSENQFVIGRRGNPCCVEDAEALYGLLSTTPKANELANDQWVKVIGRLSKTKYLINEVPYLIVEEVIEIEPPKDPYVYEPE